MNEALKLNNINNYLDSIGIKEKGNFLYAQLDEGISNVLVKSFLLNFGHDKITFIEMTFTGNFANKYFDVLREDIISINCKDGMIFNKIEIVTKSERFKFKSNKVISGSPWQKDNSINLLKNNFNSDIKKSDKELVNDNMTELSENDNSDLEEGSVIYKEHKIETTDNNKKNKKIGKLLGITVSIILAVFIFIIWTDKNRESEKMGTNNYKHEEVAGWELSPKAQVVLNMAGAFQGSDLSEKAFNVLSENEELFPSSYNEYSEYLDMDLDYKDIIKNVNKMGNSLYYCKGTTLFIQESESKGIGDFTLLQLADGNSNLHTIIYFSTTPNVYEGDRVEIVSLPLGILLDKDKYGKDTLSLLSIAADIQ